MTIKLTLAIVMVTALLGVIAVNDAAAASNNAHRATLVAHAKTAIKEQLRDPDSAKFKILGFAGEDEAIVCGTVNAKNGYGGYVGSRQFMYQDDGHQGHAQMATIVGSTDEISREGLTENTVQQIVAQAVCDPKSLKR